MGVFNNTFGNTLATQGALLNYPSVLKDGDTFGFYRHTDLSSITKNGSNITSRINDILGSGHDFTTGQSTWSLEDGFTLNGTTQFLKTTTAPFEQPEVCYLVMRQNTWVIGGKILDGFTDLSMVLQQYSVTPNLSGYAGALVEENGKAPIGTWVIVQIIFDGINSSIQINDNAPVTGNFGIKDANGITLGRDGEYAGDYCEASYMEMIFRKSLVGKTEIYNYLKNKYNYIMHDEFAATSIDAAKWDIVNTNPESVTFRQSDSLIIDTLPNFTGGWFQNMIKSKKSAVTGIFRFSVGIPFQFDYICNHAFGLYQDNSNHILLRTGVGSNTLRYAITVAGVTVYQLDIVDPLDFNQFKIIITETHDVKLFRYHNDAWVQIGVTTNAVFGAKKIMASTLGVAGGILSMTDASISLMDNGSPTPFGVSTIATDARTFGAIPDALTDNAEAVNTALLAGNVLLQNGTFAVSSSVLVPSNRTLYIKNATIRLNDDSFDNVFRNADPLNGNSNVNIIGISNAYIDGNGSNNNSVDYSIYGGIGNLNANDLYKANLFFIGKVNTFEITNLFCCDRQAYTACLQKASNGKIHDLYLSFHANTQNQDGIQSVQGTHDCEIYNIKGYTGDDFVSIYLPTKFGSLWYNYADKTIGDVYNMRYHDFYMYMNWQHGIIFINGDGNKIHDIDYRDVVINFCKFFTYFGDDPLFSGNYFTVGATKDELYNITIDNVVVNNRYSYPALISFNSNCKNVAITNFDNNTVVPDYEILSGDQSENVTINGVQIA